MKPSRTLSLRVKRLFFWIYSLSILVVIAAAWLLLEDLEATTLNADKQIEVEHFLNRHQTDEVVQVRSALLTLSYIPNGIASGEHLPVIFFGLPIPFDGEFEFLDKEYQVIIDQIPEGTYYIAKDLTLFEAHEVRVIKALIALAVLGIGLGLIVSWLIGGLISQPVRKLTEYLKNIRQGDPKSYPPLNFNDRELYDISTQINQYLRALDDLLARERALMGMASHELRTPIAVILGGTEIIARRDQLNDDDKKTLQRIHSAAQTMSDNVQTLLALVRQTHAKMALEPVSATALLDDLIEELHSVDATAAQRIRVEPAANVSITSHPIMLRMALHNLLNNALQHSGGTATVSLSRERIVVSDEGNEALATGGLQAESTGLGLYIVNLICEKMGWRFTLETRNSGTTATIELVPPAPA